jgi:integrase
MAETFTSAQRQNVISRPTVIAANRIEESKTTAISQPQTLRAVATSWGERIARRTTDYTRRDLLHRFERYVFPKLGSKLLADVEPRDILSIVTAVKDVGHYALAYNLFHEIRQMYRYAVAAGLSRRDPTSVLTNLVSPTTKKWSAALFDPAWVGGLLLAIRQYSGKVRSTGRYMYRLGPMLFLRPGELRQLEWKDVDLDSATIVIPAQRMKNRRPHVVPLARQAVRILRDVQKMTGKSPYVFTGGRGLGRQKPPGAKGFNMMLYAIGYKKVMTPHGFRVMAGTWFSEQGWRAEAIGRQLSHVTRDRNGRIYNRAEYLSERREMMQAWANYLERLESEAKILSGNRAPLTSNLSLYEPETHAISRHR